MRGRYRPSGRLRNGGVNPYVQMRSEHVNGVLDITAKAAEAALNERSYSNPSYSLDIIASALSAMNAKRLQMPEHRDALRRAGHYALDKLCETEEHQ